MRTSSIVPASTRDTYGIAQFGEYSIATRFTPVEQLGEARVQLRAAGVHRLRSRQVIEVVAFDRVHERLRLTGLRDQVEPAPRREVAGAAHPGQPVRHRIRAVKIVEEPRVEPVGLEGFLDGSNIKGHIHTIIPADEPCAGATASYN